MRLFPNSQPLPTDEAFDAATQFGTLAPFYDELMDVVPYEQWTDYVMMLFAVAEHTPHRLLECACGTGNVTFELASHQIAVTGIDLSEEMLAIARGKAKTAVTSLPVRFLQADLTSFDLGERYDTATCLYDSLNYILEPEGLQAAFAHIARHIEPGGIFVFDMNSDYALRADLFSQCNIDPRKKLHYDWRASYDADTRLCTVRMVFERQNEDGTIDRFHERHRERAYLLPEIEAMLEASGWETLRTFDAYTMNRPHGKSERWFFVARRRSTDNDSV